MKVTGLQDEEWFHGKLDRKQSSSRLLGPNNKHGDFLVRESSTKDGFLAVSVNRRNKLMHFLILGGKNKWYISVETQPRVFKNIVELISYYRELGPEQGLGAPAIVDGTADQGKCSVCRSALNAGVEFCGRCGARVMTSPEYQIVFYADRTRVDWAPERTSRLPEPGRDTHSTNAGGDASDPVVSSLSHPGIVDYPGKSIHSEPLPYFGIPNNSNVTPDPHSVLLTAPAPISQGNSGDFTGTSIQSEQSTAGDENTYEDPGMFLSAGKHSNV